MENKIVFGRWEAAALLINAICARIFLNFPRQFIETAGTAACIITIYVSIVVLLAFFLISKLYRGFEGKDLIDIADFVGSKVLRIIVGLVITALLLYISSVILREYSENMKVIALTVSPLSFVMIFFLVGMIIGAYKGIESIVRFHAIVLPIVILGLAIILIGVVPYCDMSNLAPVLGEGIYSIFGKGFFDISIFAPMLYLFLMAPFIKTHKNFKKAGFLAVGLSAVLLLLTSFVYLLVFPYTTALENFLPVYELARLINYGRFFQRVESVFMLAWAATALMYLSAIMFFLVYVFRKTFELEYHRPLIFPFAIIILSLSLLPQNLMSAIKLETKYYGYFAWLVTFAMTIILLFAAKVLKGRKKKERAKCE